MHVQWNVSKPSGNTLNVIVQLLKYNFKMFLEDLFFPFFFSYDNSVVIIRVCRSCSGNVMFSFLKLPFSKVTLGTAGYFNCHFKCWVEWKSWPTQRMFESIPNVTGRYHCMDTWEEHTSKTKVKFICQVICQILRTLSVLICAKQHSWNDLYL